MKKISIKLNNTQDIKIYDDIIIGIKSSYILLETGKLIELNSDKITFKEKDRRTSFLINYIKGSKIEMYNNFKFE